MIEWRWIITRHADGNKRISKEQKFAFLGGMLTFKDYFGRFTPSMMSPR